MQPVLQVQLLGNFQLRYSDKRITQVNSARLQSLLAYLVLNRDAPQSRQHLSFIFWPNSTESWQRQRFFEALARAFIGNGRPLLLLFDDLQWCDQQTLEWLHFLIIP